MEKDYYIGLDIGTDSVGWAVTDTDYRLLRARGQDLWGSYLFDEAQVAEDRRTYRAARRRTARVRQRLQLLQSLFAEEISKVDPLFFLRLNNSSLFAQDKDGRLKSADALFGDKNYRDKQYYKQYPTISHLRMALLSQPITDIRLLYLAIHHILKNRGHFLFEAQSLDANDTQVVKGKFYQINAYLAENEWAGLELSELDEALQVLKNTSLGKQKKCKRLQELFHIGKEKQLIAIIKAMTGCTVKVQDLYAEAEEQEIKDFCFDKAGFDETDCPNLEAVLGEEKLQLILMSKAIYDWSVLCNIMGDYPYVSMARVAKYQKHQADLARLKAIVRPMGKEMYKLVFRRQDKVNNYAAYIGMDRQKGFGKCTQEEFYKFLRNTVKITDPEILQEMEEGNFLPKQVSNTNGVIPYQVHLKELRAILQNAEKQFPFLLHKQDGMTVSERIEALMTFRIPYYVGPLDTRSRGSFAVRRAGYETTKITPWNFAEAIDTDASEQKFIRSMTNKCTYLPTEDVLPASSLLYSEFAFLNELNNLRINGEKDARARQLIYEYALTHKKVTLKKCLDLLIRNGLVAAESKVQDVFSGLADEEFHTSLAPFVDLQFLGDRLYTHREMCEEIILWITLLSDKNRLEKRIRDKYGKILSEAEIKRLKGLHYTKWGRLSAQFLDGIISPTCVDENGECLTIIGAMRKTGENLMQLLSSRYDYQDAIRAYLAENTPSEKVTYQTVQDLYCSPSVKRAIWRSIELIREIVKIRQQPPKRIFVETTRQKKADGKGDRTVSRKQQLLDLYRAIEAESRDWTAEINNTPDAKFNRDRLVLYYRQMGRSMYSGKPITLEQAFDTNVCDIDHIYPQSKIKDDSLDNRVLVFKTENAIKSDNYPLPAEIRSQMRPFWQELKEHKLISKCKYERLVRSNPLTQDEQADFINRQLVSTAQSTKAVIELLQRMYPDTDLVYAKAANANEFKDEYGIVKVRELNNLHHAKDAYINIVVGNVYYTKFNRNAFEYFKTNGLNSYNMQKLFDRDIPGAWKVSECGRIVQTTEKNTCRIVRMTERGKGALFNATIKTAGANDKLIPLKANGAIADTAKYGGYDSATTAYFMLVESVGKKGKKMLSLEAYPLYWVARYGEDQQAKLRYCIEQAGLTNPVIRLGEIKRNTLFCLNGSYAYLRGITGKQIIWCNANELFLDKPLMQILKRVVKYGNARKKLNRADLPAPETIDIQDNLRLYDALLDKLGSKQYAGLSISGQLPFLQSKRDAFIQLSVEDQCTVLIEVLRLMQCNSTLSNFTKLNGVAHAGSLLTAKFIQDMDAKIILQSPTGYYRRVIRLDELQ